MAGSGVLTRTLTTAGRTFSTTSAKLTEHALARIDALDPKLNAFLLVTKERALADAERADRELRAGRDRGPLHGIPYALKDIYEQQFINLLHSQPIGDWTLGANLGYFIGKEDGNKLAGELDNKTAYAMLSANYAVPAAVVAQSLGRAPSGNVTNVTVNLLEPGSSYGDRINQLDFRFAKILRFGGSRTMLSAL